MSTRQQGLTLIELMVTLAVAIILLAVGLPFFGGIVANNRAVVQANGLLTSFKLARSEAVKRSSFVAVAPTSVSVGWEAGWQVFQESNVPGEANFGVQQDAVAEPTLRSWDVLDATVNGAPAFVAFESTGEATAAADIALVQDTETGARSHCLSVGVSGLVRMEPYRPEAPSNETCP